ncbi:MAG: hypothetical protein OCD76_09735 [Reichenbachiella sp.]
MALDYCTVWKSCNESYPLKKENWPNCTVYSLDNITSGPFSYSVEVTDQYGCSVQDEIIISVNLATVANISIKDISKYPNPASQKLLIEGLTPMQNIFNLYDLSGRLKQQWMTNDIYM